MIRNCCIKYYILLFCTCTLYVWGQIAYMYMHGSYSLICIHSHMYVCMCVCLGWNKTIQFVTNFFEYKWSILFVYCFRTMYMNIHRHFVCNFYGVEMYCPYFWGHPQSLNYFMSLKLPFSFLSPSLSLPPFLSVCLSVCLSLSLSLSVSLPLFLSVCLSLSLSLSFFLSSPQKPGSEIRIMGKIVLRG